jgi:hypothetical protein
MRLAVLVDPVGKAFQPPIFGLADRTAAGLDDALELVDKLIDALSRHVLPGQENVFVKCHPFAFPKSSRPGAEPRRSLNRHCR